MGITHFDDAPALDYEIGHIKGHWTALGEAAGSVTAGVRRIQVPAGGWSTPAHEHGADEEIFYVLAGRGRSWQKGRTTEIATGDCIVYLVGRGAHTLHALEPLDVLAFGTRSRDAGVGFPRLGMSLVGKRAVESGPGAVDGAPFQFVREAELGPPELSEPGERPATVVNLGDVEARHFGRGPVSSSVRDLGVAAGSQRTGIRHYEVDSDMNATPAHCHSLEEEIFVILGGEGLLVLDEEETPVRPGHVIARPAATGVSHMFRAGSGGLEFLAYGTRESGDMCFYPRSNKVSFRGLGVVARVERLDYWDGED
ncbi:MAG: cupin domain-containing protein [Solirubrobacteraceae bacterium]